LAARARIGTITGTFTRPGVSKNRRKYTRETVDKAVNRMQTRIADPSGMPVTMLTHHGAGDDSTRIAARVTRVWQLADGTAKWEADIADNAAGHDIAALTGPDNPYLRNVSIRGWWLGDVHTEMVNGIPHDVGDDLEIDGIDFTKNPGVEAARIDSVTLADTSDGLARTPIFESVEEAQVTVEDATTQPYGDVPYADPGYQSDSKKRYPIDTKAHIRAAWAYINKTSNQKPYTTAQVKRIKGRIKAAAKKAGIDVAAETQAITAALTEALEDAWASMRLDNGQGDISVSGYTNDPEMLAQIGKQVGVAALAALTALDPDNDGDIDIPGGDADDSLDDEDDLNELGATGATETNPEGNTMTTNTTVPTAEALAAMTREDRSKALLAMSETDRNAMLPKLSTQQLAEFAAEQVAPPKKTEGSDGGEKKTPDGASAATTENGDAKAPDAERNLTDADVAALAAAIKGGTEPAAAAPADGSTTTETAPDQAAVDKLVDTIAGKVGEKITADVIDKVGKSFARHGGRRGLVATEGATPAKPLHEMSEQELQTFGRDAFEQVLPIS
jgi:hypothetical protein